VNRKSYEVPHYANNDCRHIKSFFRKSNEISKPLNRKFTFTP